MINAPTKATLNEPAAVSNRFTSVAGEMGEMIRSFNWTSSSLGPSDQWSPALKTCIQILLSSAQPMLVCWGRENIHIYNDACRELLGSNHPLSLGQPAATVWPAFLDISPDITLPPPQLELLQADGSCYRFNGSLIKEDTGEQGVLFVGSLLTNPPAYTFAKTDIVAFIRAVLEQMDPVIRTAGLTLVINLDMVTGEVYLNRDLFEKILLSLLRNALCHTVQGGIAVRLCQQDQQLFLSVADSGIGMTPALLEEVNAMLLEPPHGRGGLALVQETMGIHGGALRISSTPDEGTTVTLLFPIGQPLLATAALSNGEPVVFKSYEGYLSGLATDIRMAREKVRRQKGSRYYQQLLETLPDTAYTREKEGHTLLEEYVAKLAAIVESSDDAIISKTLDGIITSWNPAAERLFGFTAEEMIGTSITRIIPADKLDEEPRIIDALRSGQRVDHFETKRRTKSGELLDISLTISPVKDLQGNVVGASKIARDITQQKIMFRALQDSESKYMQLAVKLEALVEQRTRELQESNFYLEKSNRELEQFAYVTSHDLQEPLRKIHTFAGMLHNVNKDILSETSNMYIEKVMLSARRMSQLINELLDYSRLVHMKEPFVETDLNEILKNVLTDFEVVIGQHNVEIVAGQLPRLAVSPLQMNQLFHNLIGNAIKFLVPGRKPLIRIAAKLLSTAEVAALPDLDENHHYYGITVQDNGIGFDQVYADKIFQIFQRLNDRSTYEGTGIGLALCNKIVLNHKGIIYATGVPDQGAIFKVVLPE